MIQRSEIEWFWKVVRLAKSVVLNASFESDSSFHNRVKIISFWEEELKSSVLEKNSDLLNSADSVDSEK